MEMIFLAAVTFIFVHELDAIRQGEWRFFLHFTGLSDEAQYRIFTALHVPLFMAIIWFIDNPTFQIGFDLFLIIHVGLHWMLRKHQHIDFNTWFSWIWILGAGLLGGLHLIATVANL